MANDPPKFNLSQIETRWSLILQAHHGEGDSASSARSELMLRYSGAVHRYLTRVTQDADLAGDLAQEFALRFLRGDFHRADPSRGRFRDYVKVALLNLLADSRRGQKKQPRPLPGDGEELSDPSATPPDLEREFLDCWRDEVLRRAWERLSREQDQTGRPYYTVLRYRADHPDLRSHEMAEGLSASLGKAVNAGWVRQNLLRARHRFLGFVRAEVSHTLGGPTVQELDDELRDLGLSAFLRPPRD
jgi:RNA polymerase sigma factor (sigma-70 family)